MKNSKKHTKEEILEIKAEMLPGVIKNLSEKVDMDFPAADDAYLLLKRSIEEKQKAYYNKVSVLGYIFRKLSELYRWIQKFVMKFMNMIRRLPYINMRSDIFKRDININNSVLKNKYRNLKE